MNGTKLAKCIKNSIANPGWVSIECHTAHAAGWKNDLTRRAWEALSNSREDYDWAVTVTKGSDSRAKAADQLSMLAVRDVGSGIVGAILRQAAEQVAWGEITEAVDHYYP
jgi:hypothetical protein